MPWKYPPSCRYAHRAKSIQNSVKCNEDVNEKVIRELKEEIEKLRQQLLSGGGSGGGGVVGGGGGDNNTEAAELQVSRVVAIEPAARGVRCCTRSRGSRERPRRESNPRAATRPVDVEEISVALGRGIQHSTSPYPALP